MLWNEPCYEIMVLFVLHKLILHTCMHSYPVGLDVWFLVGPFVYFHTLCMRKAKALARLFHPYQSQFKVSGVLYHMKWYECIHSVYHTCMTVLNVILSPLKIKWFTVHLISELKVDFSVFIMWWSQWAELKSHEAMLVLPVFVLLSFSTHIYIMFLTCSYTLGFVVCTFILASSQENLLSGFATR